MKTFRPKFLPFGKYLTLCEIDRAKFQSILDKFSADAHLRQLWGLRNTNKSESMHRRVSTYAPKNVTYSRNYPGLCHSAVHSATFGNGQASLLLAKARGIKCSRQGPKFAFMKQMDERSMYDRQRQSEPEYKSGRFHTRMYKGNTKLRRDVGQNNALIDTYHGYTESILNYNMNCTKNVINVNKFNKFTCRIQSG
jgi:hypothetical protein